MKKFLPVILALAMLVVPVEAVSYVADGGLGYKLLETMKRTGATKVQAVVTLDKEGTYMSRFALFGKRNQFLTAKPCPKEAYMGIEKIIDQNHVLQEVRDLNCDRAFLIFNGYISGPQLLQIKFYNSRGNLVKSEECNDPDKYMFIFE